MYWWRRISAFRPLKARRLLQRFEDLRDEVEIVETARELCDLRGFGVRRRLERIMRTHPNEETRAMAAWTLGFRSDERAAQKLVEAFTDPDEAVYVRSYAAEGLGHLFMCEGEARRISPIVIEGLHHPSPELRFWSCFALANFRDASALPELEELVGDTTAVPGWWPVGEEAQWAIAQIHGDTEFEPPGMKAWPRVRVRENHPE